MCLYGETANVDDTAIQKSMDEVKRLCRKYKVQNTFAAMRPVCFSGCYRDLHTSSYRKDATMYVCTNATGLVEVPIPQIEKYRSPRCFRGKRVLIKYLFAGESLV